MGEAYSSPIGCSKTIESLSGINPTGIPPYLFLLMTILSQSFLAFVRSHLVAFSFLSAWHTG